MIALIGLRYVADSWAFGTASLGFVTSFEFIRESIEVVGIVAYNSAESTINEAAIKAYKTNSNSSSNYLASFFLEPYLNCLMIAVYL